VILRVKCKRRCAALMAESVRNHVLKLLGLCGLTVQISVHWLRCCMVSKFVQIQGIMF